MILLKTAQDVMGREENEQISVGQDWVYFDAVSKNMAKRKMRFVVHVVRKSAWKND